MPENHIEQNQEFGRVVDSASPKGETPLWKVAVPVLILAGVLAFGVRWYASGNADYICTRVIETEGLCANGAWGDWQTTNTTTTAGVETRTERRVYTGSRILSRTVEYLNLRTSCAEGFTQTLAGNGGGASGFHGGDVVTTSQVCQVEQERTTYTNTTTGTQTGGVAVVTQETYGDTTEETTAINDFSEIDDALLDARRDAVNLDIYVEPALVAAGTTTTVTWNSVEMTMCAVSADENIDAWGSITSEAETVLAGEEASAPIQSETIYTLDCIDFEGNPHQKTAIVRMIPVFQEF